MSDTHTFQTVTEIPKAKKGRPVPPRYQAMMDHLDANPGEIVVVDREDGGSALYQWFRKHRASQYKVVTRGDCFYLAKLGDEDAS